MRFLLIEDNAPLASAVVDRLSLDGHVVDHAPDLETARDFSATTAYDMILLDIMLPDGDGSSFLAHHRSRENGAPIIVLTARSEVSDRISLLDQGADDYMVKPIDFAELEARCRAVLRRRDSGPGTGSRTLGTIRFDPASGTLGVGGRDIQLRTRELRLFEILINAPGMIFSKSALVDRLFSYDEDVSENAIEVYVARLRKHLGGSDVAITTVRGLGYKLEQM
ncbi:response regulator transcription factor [Sulfitobacter sp. D35]|uniref:response regulator transcription factor n=1 Tax=Sulfitobacter sp. D35 TaxID=3083252 RepID=UPI00296EB36E|nr:response regulator transcription factor [Sulfitobacter sp. D35]MDW4496672.1 response regulator transcription factor [Sulfitobacter sp. D35]